MDRERSDPAQIARGIQRRSRVDHRGGSSATGPLDRDVAAARRDDRTAEGDEHAVVLPPTHGSREIAPLANDRDRAIAAIDDVSQPVRAEERRCGSISPSS